MTSQTKTSITDEIKRDEAKKLTALNHMLRVVGQGRGDGTSIRDYIESAGRIDVAAYVAACDELRETWTNTFSAPQPGHIWEAARRYRAKSRAEIQHEHDRRRMAQAEASRMTRASIAEELDRVDGLSLPDDPFEKRVEKRRRAGLQRILDGLDGKPIAVKPMQPRGDGGLQKPDFGEVL